MKMKELDILIENAIASTRMEPMTKREDLVRLVEEMFDLYWQREQETMVREKKKNNT